MATIYLIDPVTHVPVIGTQVVTGGGGGPPPPPSGILRGINVGNTTGAPNSSPTQRLAQYGRIPCSRVFYTGMIPNVIGNKEKKNSPEFRCQPSFKANPTDIANGVYDATITSYISSIPSTWKKLFLTYYHEPNDQFSAGTFTFAQWAAAQYHLSALIASHGDPRVILMPNMSGPKGPNGGTTPWNSSWILDRSLMTNDNAIFSFDSYGQTVNGLGANYVPYDQVYDRIYNEAIVPGGWNQDGKWGETETNTTIRSWDTTPVVGTQRAAWITGAFNYIETHFPTKPHHTFLWEGNGSTGTNFNFNDAPSIAAWRAINLTSV